MSADTMNISIQLPVELTIYTVAELHLTWLAAATGTITSDASDDEPCNVDASKVQEVDTAGMQLLLSLAGLINRQRRSLHLLDASEPIRRACTALGVAALLHPPGAAQVNP